MKSALIGYTGFVGGNLMSSAPFDDVFNSANIRELSGRHYHLIVCAGAPGAKWKANQAPEQDLSNINGLMNVLAEATADHVILISTVDIYPTPIGVDEGSGIEVAAGTAYGKHRRLLETFVQERFESTTIRLPGLFGPGLRKNVIYDFLHNNNIDRICPDSVFQFYPVAKAWEDIQRVRNHHVPLVNFATAPLGVREIAREVFGLDFTNPTVVEAARYDMRTKYATLFGKPGSYIYNAEEILELLKDYVRREGWKTR